MYFGKLDGYNGFMGWIEITVGTFFPIHWENNFEFWWRQSIVDDGGLPRQWSAEGWVQKWAPQRLIRLLPVAPAEHDDHDDDVGGGDGDDDESEVDLVVLIHEVVQQPAFVWPAVSSWNKYHYHLYSLIIDIYFGLL